MASFQKLNGPYHILLQFVLLNHYYILRLYKIKIFDCFFLNYLIRYQLLDNYHKNSQLANTPLDQVVRDNIPPGFYVYDVEYFEEQDLDGHVDKEYTVSLHNDEGTREIAISHEPPHDNWLDKGRHASIRVHKLVPGKTWPNGKPMQQGMLDYTPVLFGLDQPEVFKEKMTLVLQRMK